MPWSRQPHRLVTHSFTRFHLLRCCFYLSVSRSLQVWSGALGANSKEARGKYRHDKLQAYLAELMDLLGEHPGWIEKIPELDDFFELSKRVPQVRARRACILCRLRCVPHTALSIACLPIFTRR